MVTGSASQPQRLGAMKEEHAARPQRPVGMVAEQDLGAGGDIFEADLALAPDEMLRTLLI
jgi:hypothetical protein